MEKLSVKEYLEIYGLELYVVGDRAYIYDAEYASDSDKDFGVWDYFPVSNLLGDMTGNEISIPDYCVDSEYDSLINNEFYKFYLPKSEIKKLEHEEMENWPDILREDGYSEVADKISNICEPLKEDYVFKSMTEEEIESCRPEKIPVFTVNNVRWDDGKYYGDVKLPTDKLWTISDIDNYIYEKNPGRSLIYDYFVDVTDYIPNPELNKQLEEIQEEIEK